jgi:uncharacterized protein YjbJ (UPF0337 family)
MGEIFDKTKGKIKQAVGNATGNDKLVREGKIDVAKGNVKGAVADVKDAAKKAKDAVADAIDDATDD